MNFIYDLSEEDNLSDTLDYLKKRNYSIMTTGNVSIGLVFIQSHNDLMDEKFKKVIYKYINDKTPYVLISQTQPNIQLNCLNTFLNLKIDISPFIDDYSIVYDYIKELDTLYTKMFNINHINESHKKVKINLKRSQEKVQDEIEDKIKRLKNLLND